MQLLCLCTSIYMLISTALLTLVVGCNRSRAAIEQWLRHEARQGCVPVCTHATLWVAHLGCRGSYHFCHMCFQPLNRCAVCKILWMSLSCSENLTLDCSWKALEAAGSSGKQLLLRPCSIPWPPYDEGGDAPYNTEELGFLAESCLDPGIIKA